MGDTTIMTVQSHLNTKDVKDLWDYSRHIIGAKRRHRHDEGPSSLFMPGAHEYVMHPRQGLPLCLKVFHNRGGLLPQLGDHGDRYVEIWLDDGTTGSHTRVRSGIGEWMTGRGWAWRWRTDHTNWQNGR